MKLLFTVAAVLLALLLLGQVRVGCVVSYQQEGLFLWLRTGVVRIRVLPWKRKKKEKPVPGKKDGNGPDRRKTCPREGRGAGVCQKAAPHRTGGGGTVSEEAENRYPGSGIDHRRSGPCGRGNGLWMGKRGLGTLWYPLVEGFHIVDGRARVRLDLEAPAVSLRGRASLSLKLGQICRLAVYLG